MKERKKKPLKAKIPVIAGCILMLAVIIVCVPLTIPRIFQIQIYRVMTASMEPAYPEGSIIYIKHAEPEEVSVGDVITYTLGTDTEYTQTHRVIAITEDAFITKGDANTAEDEAPVAFDRLVGIPIGCIPHYATLYNWVHSIYGILGLVLIFLLAIFLFLLSDFMVKAEELRAIEKPKEEEKKKKEPSVLPYILLGMVLIAGAAVIFWMATREERTSRNREEEIREAVLSEVSSDKEDAEDASEEETEEYLQLVVDFEELWEINEEVIGWIVVDGTDISYPILQTTDNDTYLHTAVDGTYDRLGSIFLDMTCSSDFEDLHSILYGHYTRYELMFAKLNSYAEEDFYKEHRYFTIYLPDKVLRYEIFSAHRVESTSNVYTTGFSKDDFYEAFLEQLKSESIYDTGVLVDGDDRIVTLSTCYEDYLKDRFVVHGRCIQTVER